MYRLGKVTPDGVGELACHGKASLRRVSEQQPRDQGENASGNETLCQWGKRP